MKASRLLLGIAAAAFACAASAQDRRPDYGPSITLAQAKKVAAGVLAACAKNSWNVAVAIVDPHGFLVYFERMENTQHGGIEAAIGKARTAALYRRPTRAFAEVINKGSPATATLPGVVANPGGLPLMVDGKVIGATGVSGVTGDQDEECAKAGTM